ncbi:MAG TPA: RIP metalloprotease RseP [bacterium]|nr:RIP metalloprotease RseP [bacterium]
MLITIIIAFFSLVGLMTLHEFGHFLFAKKFGVKVEEFGIGYPPRIFGKKIGETIYSLNLLPFGAFVRLPGEIGENHSPDSFSQQPISKRVLIILGGVLSFWIIAAIIFSIVFTLGAPIAIDDETDGDLINPRVQIVGLAKDSPAEIAGLKIGDAIKEMSFLDIKLIPEKTKQIQDFTSNYLGKEINLTIERGKEILHLSLIPRISPPQGEGAMGIALVRTAIKKSPLHLALWEGIVATGDLTVGVIRGYLKAINNVITGKPSGVQMTGPVGVFQMLSQAQELGITYYLNFLAMISIYLAVFNLMPIPAVDGGKLMFLTIEAIRKKPVSEKVEQNITAVFFVLLIILMVFVTINDINRIF